MPGHMRPQLGKLVGLPLATIGVLAAVLVWEIEHIGSIFLALAIASIGMLIGILVAQRVRKKIDELADHYENLLLRADTESRNADEANRVKDEFLTTLSHELRTPLNSILGWARLLASGKLDKEQSGKAVQAIERAGWAQSRLIEDLLDLSRIVSGQLHISPRPTLLQPLVETVVQSLQPAAVAKEITVTTRLNPTIGTITADPERLQQIVWNLLSNAIKFTPARGHVLVEVGPRNNDVCIAVVDTGNGFSPETAARLFERFRQGDSSTTRAYGGLGLGLGIVRHLVEAHGGTVNARSEGMGRGATFEVILPIRRTIDYVAEVTPPRETAPLLRGISVLVVDNDADALAFVRASLEHYGAVVTAVSTASEARERFKSSPPDVLLSDLRMPGEDGLELIRTVRQLDAERGRTTPAAALTAMARTEDRRESLNAGYQMHVTKPIDPFELAVTVQHLADATA
jgi:signal transduction histidine kinase/CheY-like chemotaxis protein